ncbi:Resolvase domain protein [Gloeothece citriformis PCC 7424]|uniref:Resolvase domain protein n=1 Tax=Gloeothece citriformis (strain PCC 7424) TaxID=65393 RepID=B7KG17_GLOC7|nr:IS607 family transposase [Gloeothece citriformis]ACK69210.1 Resolvase domain protein [Gloeothece citriformis PCC 7424]
MEKRYKPGEFALKINRSVGTLRLWDRSGKLPAKRLPSGQRYYTEEDLNKALRLDRPLIKKKIIVYTRVSSPKQKQDLIRQSEAMEQFCLARGYIIDEVIEEIGGGLNYTRPQFLRLMKMIENREVKILVIAFKDRLCRFGFEYFEYFLTTHEGKLVIANAQTLSPQQELIEDLMAVIHSFSSRLYGLRKYKKEISKIISEPEPTEIR